MRQELRGEDGWFHIVVMATLLTLAKVMVVVLGKGGKEREGCLCRVHGATGALVLLHLGQGQGWHGLGIFSCSRSDKIYKRGHDSELSEVV